MKYLSNKPMFFDMGKKPVDPFDGLRAEPAPSNYFTSAPASLYSCQGDCVIRTPTCRLDCTGRFVEPEAEG